MKNYIRLFGIIVFSVAIGFSSISCEDEMYEVENTIGSLTITGLVSNNNQYIIAFAGPVENPSFTAAANILTDGSITYGEIKNSEVKLKVWKSNDNLHKFTNYNGSDQNVVFHISCKATLDSESVNVGYVKVNFLGGTGTGAFQPY